MSGLLEKDLRLTVKRKQTLVIFVFMALIMGISTEGTFIIGYLVMLGIILAIGSISYDEYDNGFAFLMTLPVKRKTYVLEKYLFCAGMSAVSWIVAVIVSFVLETVRGNAVSLAEELPMMLMIVPMMMTMAAIMIPLQLRFGAEKSRIVLFVIFGAVIAGSFFMKRLVTPEESSLQRLAMKLEGLSPALGLAVSFGICLVLCSISYLCSVKVMERKEF
ncbi:MAG: ABC-2 transporter permease [Blautia sp.]|nr:ABC-2 transporter permease [Blautia sp.]